MRLFVLPSSYATATALVAITLCLAGVLLSPGVAAACCADIERQTPIGWSADGSRLLVETYSSTECVGRSVAEVRRTGSDSTTERYDLHDSGRSLGSGEDGRSFDMDELYELHEAAGEGNALFTIPDSLTRRFGRPARALCARDVYARASADPSDPLDTPAYESHVLLTVQVRVMGELTLVADAIRLPRFFAESGRLYVHPSPDGRRAIVRINTDGPELAADDLTWITLPAGASPARAGCETAALVFPSPDNARDPILEPGDNWLLESAARSEHEVLAQMGTTDEDVEGLLMSQLVGGLWLQPDHHSARAALVAALERSGQRDIAAALTADLPQGPIRPLAEVAAVGDIEDPRGESRESPDVSTIVFEKLPLGDALCAGGADGGCALPFELPRGAGDASMDPQPLSCAVATEGADARALLLPAISLVGIGGLLLLLRRRRR